MELTDCIEKVVDSVSGKASCGSAIEVEYNIGGTSKDKIDPTTRPETEVQNLKESAHFKYTNRDWQLDSKWSAFGQWLLSLAPYVTMIWLAYIVKATLAALKGAIQ